MTTEYQIRLVELRDVPQILDIYRPFVLETNASFETEVPALADFEKRVMAYAGQAPWLVAHEAEKVLGYAYATGHRSRGAYRWAQEVTVYVHPEYRKRGIAGQLYQKLLEILRHLGYTKAMAIITLPNEASIRFHSSLGFQHIGDMPDIGFKFGQFHTTSWWHKPLQAEGFEPGKILSVSEASSLL